MRRDALDTFGRFVIANLRDKSLEQHEMLQRGQLRAAHLLDMQRRFLDLSDEQQMLIEEIVVDIVDTSLHDMLFAIQDAYDRNQGIEVTAAGHNVAEISGMLHGEIQGTNGWIARFSRFLKHHQ